MNQTGVFYPITITGLGERRALVVGGGPVAERKVRGLLDAGIKTTVVSPSVTEQIERWSREKRIELMRRRYQQSDCSGAALVYAATDSIETNAEIAVDAEQRDVLCNVASDPALGTFHLPAVYRGDAAMIAVSTYGLSPSLAARLRDKIADWIEEDDER